jgi:hypothetical protein
MKVAPSALRISLALREMAGVRETVMAAATYILRGGADAMAVSLDGSLLLMIPPLPAPFRASAEKSRRDTIVCAAKPWYKVAPTQRAVGIRQIGGRDLGRVPRR